MAKKGKQKAIKPKAAKSLTRTYDNRARVERSALLQKKIIEGMVELLVERKGGDASTLEIAERAGVSERTVFRFFKDRAGLEEATNQYLVSYLRTGFAKLGELNFRGFARYAFQLFDRHEPLVLAYLFSGFGRDARNLFRRQLNAAVMAKIASERGLDPEKHRKKLALMATLLNAKIWYDLKTDFGYSGEEMADTIEWAVETLAERI